jgi:hypothetical protein
MTCLHCVVVVGLASLGLTDQQLARPWIFPLYRLTDLIFELVTLGAPMRPFGFFPYRPGLYASLEDYLADVAL